MPAIQGHDPCRGTRRAHAPADRYLPKPLLRAGGKSLIEYHLENLARAGFAEIVINHAHLGHMIEAALGDGNRYGVHIRYSHEPAALETAGGIAQALPLLEDGVEQQSGRATISDGQCGYLLRNRFFHPVAGSAAHASQSGWGSCLSGAGG